MPHASEHILRHFHIVFHAPDEVDVRVLSEHTAVRTSQFAKCKNVIFTLLLFVVDYFRQFTRRILPAPRPCEFTDIVKHNSLKKLNESIPPGCGHRFRLGHRTERDEDNGLGWFHERGVGLKRIAQWYFTVFLQIRCRCNTEHVPTSANLAEPWNTAQLTTIWL